MLRRLLLAALVLLGLAATIVPGCIDIDTEDQAPPVRIH